MPEPFVPAPRPESLTGETVTVATACGDMCVTLNYHEGKVFEVFARMAHGRKPCAVMLEAAARLLSYALRAGAPVKDMAEQLSGIVCPVEISSQKPDHVSCAGAIAKALEKYAQKTKLQG